MPIDYPAFSELRTKEDLDREDQEKSERFEQGVKDLSTYLSGMLVTRPYTAEELMAEVPPQLDFVLRNLPRDPVNALLRIFEENQEVTIRYDPDRQPYYGLDAKLPELEPSRIGLGH